MCTAVSDEVASRSSILNNVWINNKLKIAKPCASRIGLLISGLPQIQNTPDLHDLRGLSERQPFDAVVRLVDDFVVPLALWDKFLEMLDDVGLESVREDFFAQPLKGTLPLAV